VAHYEERCESIRASQRPITTSPGAGEESGRLPSHSALRGGAAYQPDFAEAHNDIAVATPCPASDEAIAQFQLALKLDPNLTEARENLERVQASDGDRQRECRIGASLPPRRSWPRLANPRQAGSAATVHPPTERPPASASTATGCACPWPHEQQKRDAEHHDRGHGLEDHAHSESPSLRRRRRRFRRRRQSCPSC